jgi:hypothetical protein
MNKSPGGIRTDDLLFLRRMRCHWANFLPLSDTAFSQTGDQWHKFDDETVTAIPEKDVVVSHLDRKFFLGRFYQEPILRLLNLQLQRQHCSRLEHF